jgi:hypothetical protein
MPEQRHRVVRDRLSRHNDSRRGLPMGLHIMAANHVERSCLVNLHTTMIRLPAGSRGDRRRFSLVPMLALGQETATWPPFPKWPSARELQRPKSCRFSSTSAGRRRRDPCRNTGAEVTLARLIGAFVVNGQGWRSNSGRKSDASASDRPIQSRSSMERASSPF